jgi:lipopolysaccharide transport system ATP-binding protein
MDSLVVEGLSKCYDLGGGDKAKRLAIRERLRAVLGRSTPGDADRAARRQFWALKDVSFRVEPGTVLGVIGANGAGKSTLLKILARIIAPTAGRVVGVGRVVSLLELGAGFDPDLSARDNILMNAAMLGVGRHDALGYIPDILAFADVEQFVDSPLKHYSSGMYLRLAFSVAMHMKPDILLADEILAVGDQAFQERCLQRVAEGGRDGLTVLFVSHDMDAIVRVCSRVIWLNGGQVVGDGEPEGVVDLYQNATWAHSDAGRFERGRRANRLAEIISVRLASEAGREIGGAPTTEDVYIKILLRSIRPKLGVRSAVDVSSRNQLLFRAADAERQPMRQPGIYEILMKIPANLLASTSYSATVSCVITKDADHAKEVDTGEFPLVVYNALSFMAFATDEPEAPSSGRLERTPLIAPRLEWTTRRQDDAANP